MIPDPGRASRAVEMVTGAAPFDAIRVETLEGREYWSARDLMPLLGYEKWERFADAIARAKVAAFNSGYDVAQNFPGAGKVSGQRGPASQDYHLSRYACYLVAMSSDARKEPVARALTYFAIKTREAELAVPAPALTDDEIMHQALTISARRVSELTERVAELEPKAEFYDDLMEADGTYSMLATSKMLGWGRNVMMRELRHCGVLQGNNLPYQRYEHHFKVVPGTYQRGEQTIPIATTFVRPSGIEFLRKRLTGAEAVSR